MSLDRNTESSPNSPSKDDGFVPFASYRWSRSNTVRKVNSIASSAPTKEESSIKRSSIDDLDVTGRQILDRLNVEHGNEKLRKYLTENAYRQSLESISEYKIKSSFTSPCPPSRECSSFESSSSDCTDYALRTAIVDTSKSESSSYLSWIESLNSEYLTSATTAEASGKTGEWNNFWLNYNNARNRYLHQQNSFSCNSMSTSENTTAGDEFLDANKSFENIQKEAPVELSGDLFYMTRSEIFETIKCCQKIIEVLQTVMTKTAEMKIDNTRKDSAYGVQQKRVISAVDSQRYSLTNTQKQKYNSPKPNTQQPGSCINALFNTGVADILKRVIAKRRDSTESQAADSGSQRNIFPNWTGTNFR